MALPAAFPTTPMLDPSGVPTPAWIGFFLALYSRTGSGSGVSAPDLVRQIAQEAAARTAADSSLSTALSAETTARTAAIAAETLAREAADAALSARIIANPRALVWFMYG